ncbi:hypothetical protein BD769DRAFT_1391403 [Suillus cothurnatus]|nr:hypothetical protein BD769DRAFT_1391403 [Suillus cothurnatus]
MAVIQFRRRWLLQKQRHCSSFDPSANGVTKCSKRAVKFIVMATPKGLTSLLKVGQFCAVISTANLINYDWCDVGNTVWLQGLPSQSTPISHNPKAIDGFSSIMQNVLRTVQVSLVLANTLAHHPNLPPQTISNLRMKWDWWIKVIHDMGLCTGKGKAAKELVIEPQELT